VIVATALARGVPPTAAVGCTAPASRSSEDSPASSPATSLARCITFGSRRTCGRGDTDIDEQNGRSASASDSTA